MSNRKDRHSIHLYFKVTHHSIKNALTTQAQRQARACSRHATHPPTQPPSHLPSTTQGTQPMRGGGGAREETCIPPTLLSRPALPQHLNKPYHKKGGLTSRVPRLLPPAASVTPTKLVLGPRSYSTSTCTAIRPLDPVYNLAHVSSKLLETSVEKV